jgi:hypothetical protein
MAILKAAPVVSKLSKPTRPRHINQHLPLLKGRIKSWLRASVPKHHTSNQWAITLPLFTKEPLSQSRFLMHETDASLQRTKNCTPSPKGRGLISSSHTDSKRFPFNNFTYCLTLFSKFFSSFPHGTCSLSVSRLYLALDGIYHPFWSAIPSKPTLWKRITYEACSGSKTGFSPSMMPSSKGLIPGLPRKTFL